MVIRMPKLNLLMRTFLLALGVLCSSAGMAETRYVSDQLVIIMRQGPDDQSPRVRALSTGAPLEILEDQGTFVRVRTEAGEEGWVKAQFLEKSPVASMLLKEVNDKLARYEQENGALRQELNKFKQENKTLQKQIGDLNKDNKRLTDENLNISRVAGRPLELDKENQQLKQESAAMKSELQTLKSEYDATKESTQQRWYMAGGGVLLIGIVLGLLLPRLQRRQSEWG